MTKELLNTQQNQFSEPWDDSDVVLKVEEETFHVHSSILGLASPVFKAMFGPNFKEGHDKVVSLPGKQSQLILEMLKLIYPTSYMLNVQTNLKGLLEIAQEYSMEWLRVRIDKYFVKELNDKRVAMNFFIFAEKYSLKETMEAYIEYFMTSSCIGTLQDWQEISSDLKVKILLQKSRKAAKTYDRSQVKQLQSFFVLMPDV